MECKYGYTNTTIADSNCEWKCDSQRSGVCNGHPACKSSTGNLNCKEKECRFSSQSYNAMWQIPKLSEQHVCLHNIEISDYCTKDMGCGVNIVLLDTEPLQSFEGECSKIESFSSECKCVYCGSKGCGDCDCSCPLHCKCSVFQVSVTRSPTQTDTEISTKHVIPTTKPSTTSKVKTSTTVSEQPTTVSTQPNQGEFYESTVTDSGESTSFTTASRKSSDQTSSSTFTTVALLGGVSAFLLVIVILLLCFIAYRRRERSKSKNQQCIHLSNHAVGQPESGTTDRTLNGTSTKGQNEHYTDLQDRGNEVDYEIIPANGNDHEYELAMPPENHGLYSIVMEDLGKGAITNDLDKSNSKQNEDYFVLEAEDRNDNPGTMQGVNDDKTNNYFVVEATENISKSEDHVDSNISNNENNFLVEAN